MNLIEIKNVSFSYGKSEVLNNIDLDIEDGQIVCLLGSNGCGKTTLLDCIMGINKINNGVIKIKNDSINNYKPNELAKNIAYVPQAHSKTFPYKVIDMVLMGRTPYTGTFSSPTKKDSIIAEEALEIIGMTNYKDKIFTNLSGGEAQLVILARALAQQTPIIVMDEPTSHLDINNELMILEKIISLVKKKSISVIMATHFPNHAFYFENNDINTQVAMMNFGKIQVKGKPSDVLTEDNIREIFNVNSKILSYTDYQNKYSYIAPINTHLRHKGKVV